jgi:YVTN family beta-propeller protein
VTAYVAIHSGSVTPINTATSTALKTIHVAFSADAIAITPNGKTAYVTDYGLSTVIPIATATNTALMPISVGGSPVAIAVTP